MQLFCKALSPCTETCQLCQAESPRGSLQPSNAITTGFPKAEAKSEAPVGVDAPPTTNSLAPSTDQQPEAKASEESLARARRLRWAASTGAGLLCIGQIAFIYAPCFHKSEIGLIAATLLKEAFLTFICTRKTILSFPSGNEQYESKGIVF